MNNWTLRFRGVEVAASKSKRRGVRTMKLSAALRPAGASAGWCVKALRTELGIKCDAAALGLGAGLRRGHPFVYVTSGFKGWGQRRGRLPRGQAPTQSDVVSLGAFAYC
jgi:hypothetical protein